MAHIPGLHELLQPASEIRHSTIRQVNVPIAVHEAGKPLTDFTPVELQALAFGCDTIYMLAVGRQSPHGLAMSRHYAYQQRAAYPDLQDQDLKASSFATTPGSFDPSIAVDAQTWHERVYAPLHDAGVSVILDMVPNHAAIEEALQHPEAFVTAREETAKGWGVEEFYRARPLDQDGEYRLVAHGAGRWDHWSDTAQVHAYSTEGRAYLARWLGYLDGCCDGLRIDMSHLLLEREFRDKWGSLVGSGDLPPFLPGETLAYLKDVAYKQAIQAGRSMPRFVCEVYDRRDREALAQLGLSVSYGHDAYHAILDAVHGQGHEAIIPHLYEALSSQTSYRSVLYPSNHDEPRSRAVMGEAALPATAILALTPGADFLHYMGEEDGRIVRPPQQVRRMPTDEHADPTIRAAHERLIALRQTRLFQEGTGFIPDHSHIAHDLVAIGVQQGAHSMITCANLSERSEDGVIPLGHDTQLVEVVDLYTGKRVDEFDRSRGSSFVRIPPHTTQVLFARQGSGE